jgi:predicted nucleic acid-binding Zn ribbon protein
MTNCPICNSKVDAKDKFCSECGISLKDAPSERLWIVSMQERIKSARHNDGIFYLIAALGVLIAVEVPYVTHFIKLNNMDKVSWSLTIAGVVLFAGSMLGFMVDNNNVKALIDEMEQGPQEPEDEEEDKAINPKISDEE